MIQRRARWDRPGPLMMWAAFTVFVISLLGWPVPVHAQPPIYIGPTGALPDTEYGCSILDDVNNLAYFGSTSTPGKVVKIDMKAGTALPEVIGTLTLDAGEGRAR